MTFVEEFIALTEDRLEEVLEFLDVGFWVWDPPSEEVYWSDHLYELFQVDPNSFEPSLKGYMGLIHPEDRDLVGQQIEEAVSASKPFRYTCRIAPWDGDRPRWIEARARPVEPNDGEVPKYLGTVQEITGRVRMEKRIRTNERRLQEAQQVANLGSWEWIPATGEVHWSDHLYELFGVDPNAFDSSLEAFARFIHPDDRDGVTTSLRAAAENQEPFELEFRYQSAGSDEFGWLRSRAVPETGRHEELQRMVGVASEVTNLKRVEQAKEEARQYAELLFDLAPMALAVSTPEGTIREVNRSFEKEFGYETPEVIGTRVRDLGIWVDYADRAEVLDQLSQGNRVEQLATCFRTAEGQEREVEVSVDTTTRRGEDRLIWAIRDVTTRNRYERQLEEQALFDAVTGLPNRNLLLDRLGSTVEEARESGRSLAVLFVDLDDFKAVNDQYGHAAGDEVLTTVADRLQQAVREDDTVARIAGDEFVVLLEHADDTKAVSAAERLTEAFEESCEVEGQQVQMTASIGIAVHNPNQDEFQTGEDLLRASDSAMYQVKDQEITSYHLFGTEDYQRVRRLERKKHLRRAIEEDELFLEYQPIIDLDTEQMRGAEALVRWNHPELGRLPPGEFIPFAEECGLIGRLDRWVLRSAISQAAEWQETAAEVGPIRVNVTPHRDMNAEFQRELLDIIDQQGLSGEVLEIEITERMALQDRGQFDPLRERDVRLAIDDFGTGYSSLFYLQKLDADTLKIDPFFTQRIDTDERSLGLVEAMLEIGDRFDMEVVAEGLETTAQRDLLEQMNCPLAQGFLFAHPMPPDQIEEFLFELDDTDM